MTIKEFALQTQQYLRSAVESPFKRSHVYELMAAAFGYRTYAALCCESVFTRRRPSAARDGYHQPAVKARCRDLGYGTAADIITTRFLAALAAERLGVVRIVDVIANFRAFEDDLASEEEEPSDVLIESLQSAANRSNADAHYALALLYRTDTDDDFPQERGSAYWYQQRLAGAELSPVATEWADKFERDRVRAQNEESHLREAARLGNRNAQLDLADLFEEPLFFEQPMPAAEVEDPVRVAEIAGRLGRTRDEHYWLTVAAESGDIDSIRALIEGYDRADLTQCWAWLHFAKLLGTDLTQPSMRAYHDGGPQDGQEYDDDFGGPAYVDGDEGIRLDPLASADAATARERADEMYRNLSLSRTAVQS